MNQRKNRPKETALEHIQMRKLEVELQHKQKMSRAMRKLRVMTAFMGSARMTHASEDHSDDASSLPKASPRKLLQKGELAKREREKREQSPSPPEQQLHQREREKQQAKAKAEEEKEKASARERAVAGTASLVGGRSGTGHNGRVVVPPPLPGAGKTAAGGRRENIEGQVIPPPLPGRQAEVGSAKAGRSKSEGEEAGCVLHVRGIGGEYEDETALQRLFSQFGTVIQATVRHRTQVIQSPPPPLTTWADCRRYYVCMHTVSCGTLYFARRSRHHRCRRCRRRRRRRHHHVIVILSIPAAAIICFAHNLLQCKICCRRRARTAVSSTAAGRW